MRLPVVTTMIETHTDGETDVNTSDTALARLLQDEMNRLLDRLAGAVPGGSVATLIDDDPDLAARIAAEEARLTDLRESLIDGYRRWGESLQSLEDLWAVRTLKADRPDRRSERRHDRRQGQPAERRAA